MSCNIEKKANATAVMLEKSVDRLGSLNKLNLHASMAGKPPLELSPTTTEETLESFILKKSESDMTDLIDDDDLTQDDEKEENDFEKEYHAHPSLDALLLMLKVDTKSSRRIHPNGEIIRIDNEWLEMDMLIMLRTPNVDQDDHADNTKEQGTARNQTLSKHFKGKKRRFEFQYQGRLKKTPNDKAFYFCMELAESPKLNFLQKALVTTCMMFLKKMSPSFHFNMAPSGSNDMATGKYETRHMAFEVEKVLDRLAITKPGGSPPELGGTIPEDPERIKARREGKYNVNWNTKDIYTMTIWSHYIDWIAWEVVHIPGVKHFSMDKVLGNQSSVFLQMYLLDMNRKDKNKHYQKDIQHVVNLEFKQNPDCVPKALVDKKINMVKKCKK